MTSKTIVLTGEEIRVEYSGGCNAWLRNDGTAAVYASASAGITAGADGTVSIPAGQSVGVYGANGTVYLLGTGSVQLIGSDYSTNPFRNSATSGGSGADEQARAAIEAHEGNADIHVTADEKATWSAKADKSDIPASLPADGGNADTLANHSITDFTISENDRLITPESTTSSTLLEYINSLPKGSHIFTCANFSDMPVQQWEFICFANKSISSGWFVTLYKCVSDNVYVRTISTGGGWFTEWREISSTEERIAALEARVAALEGK